MQLSAVISLLLMVVVVDSDDFVVQQNVDEALLPLVSKSHIIRRASKAFFLSIVSRTNVGCTL